MKMIHKIFGQPVFVDKSTSKMGKYMEELGITPPGMGGDFA